MRRFPGWTPSRNPIGHRSTSPTWSFQSMVAIGTLLALVVVVFWLARRRGHDLLANRWFLRFCVIAGPLAIVALELGWVATEVGRQPWTVWQVLRTTDAASMSTRIVVELHRRADHLPRHDHRGVRRAAVDGPAMARRRGGPAQPVRSGRRQARTRAINAAAGP